MRITRTEPTMRHVCDYGEDVVLTASEVADGAYCIGGGLITWRDPDGNECPTPEPIRYEVVGEFQGVIDHFDSYSTAMGYVDRHEDQSFEKVEIVGVWLVEDESDWVELAS